MVQKTVKVLQVCIALHSNTLFPGITCSKQAVLMQAQARQQNQAKILELGLDRIDITGLNKVSVLKVLYDNAFLQTGMIRASYARALVTATPSLYFERVGESGLGIKNLYADISGDQLDLTRYSIINGIGSGNSVLMDLKDLKDSISAKALRMARK